MERRLNITPAIRRMEVDDLPRVMEIDALCLPVPWSAGVWRAEVTSPLGLHLVAEVPDGGIVGQIGSKKVLDELHITTVAVRPENRGAGIATALVRSAIELSPEVEKVLLEVRPSNAGARRLYDALGFRGAGRRPRYYGDEDALLLTLDL